MIKWTQDCCIPARGTAGVWGSKTYLYFIFTLYYFLRALCCASCWAAATWCAAADTRFDPTRPRPRHESDHTIGWLGARVCMSISTNWCVARSQLSNIYCIFKRNYIEVHSDHPSIFESYWALIIINIYIYIYIYMFARCLIFINCFTYCNVKLHIVTYYACI